MKKAAALFFVLVFTLILKPHFRAQLNQERESAFVFIISRQSTALPTLCAVDSKGNHHSFPEYRNKIAMLNKARGDQGMQKRKLRIPTHMILQWIQRIISWFIEQNARMRSGDLVQ